MIRKSGALLILRKLILVIHLSLILLLLSSFLFLFCKHIHVTLFFFFSLRSVAPVLCGWSNNQKKAGTSHVVFLD